MSAPASIKRQRLTPEQRAERAYSIAHAAAWDAGNASMRAAGRTRWNRADYAAMAREFNRLLPAEVLQVGHVALGMFFMVEGSGATWAEAFVAADKKKADDAKRYAELRAARGEP